MTVAVTIKGDTSSGVNETLTLTVADTKVTRTVTKSDLIYVAYPVSSVTEGGFGFDLGFCKDSFKVDITLVGSAATTIYKKLFYMMKVYTDPKTLTYDGQSFSVLPNSISVSQVAGQGDKRTITMDLIVVSE